MAVLHGRWMSYCGWRLSRGAFFDDGDAPFGGRGESTIRCLVSGTLGRGTEGGTTFNMKLDFGKELQPARWGFVIRKNKRVKAE